MNKRNINKKGIEGIGFFLYDSKSKLVCLHKRDKDHGNKWDCFGGGVEKNESTKEALSREVFEELEIETDFRRIKRLTSLDKKEIFFIRFPVWKGKLLRLGEGTGYAWFSISEAQQLKNLDTEALKILNKFENSK